MPELPDDFRRSHRVASENLIRAASSDSYAEISQALDEADRYEREAMRHISTQRQRALAMSLLHGVDLMRAVAQAEFEHP